MRLFTRLAFPALPCLALFASLALTAASPADGLGQVRVADRKTAPSPAASAFPIDINWTPPELDALVAGAEIRNGFVLDRTMLGAAAALLPEGDEAKPSLRKLDGVGVRVYRFRGAGTIDPAQVELVRQAYEARGWKRIAMPKKTAGLPGSSRDLWVATDGIEMRGGALLVVTPKSVSLVTFAGDLNPVDVLHLRGHFGIPKDE